MPEAAISGKLGVCVSVNYSRRQPANIVNVVNRVNELMRRGEEKNSSTVTAATH